MFRCQIGSHVLSSKRERERLRTDYIITVFRRFGHIPRKDENDLIESCMEYDGESVRTRDSQKKT